VAKAKNSPMTENSATKLRPDPPAWQRHWDLAMRLPLALYYGGRSLSDGIGLIREAANRDWSAADLAAITDFLSRVTLTLFMLSVALSVVLRFRRIGAADGVYPRLVAVLGTFILLATPTLPRHEPAPVLQLVASALMLLGYGLSLLVMLRLGRSFSIMPEARQLVTVGPYRLVRHPLYVTEEIAIIGLFLNFLSLPGLLLFLLHGALQLERMRLEEQVLRRAFPEYQAYAACTARLVPGLY
jgi:protein-S-isoprenylcysteine O-methyltransferase Ste14